MYSFSEIENKWQKYWQEHNTFKTKQDSDKPTYYVLDMFPYPSGSGLHVGHPKGYTATDIITRHKIMNDFNVLHPMGWDAFGLPAERYAMQTGVHPSITTEQNINNFRRQMQAIGFAYDWSREINTTDERYYRWTQWIFLLIYNSWFDEKQNKARPIDELPIPPELEEPSQKKEKQRYIDSKRLAYIAKIPVNYCAKLGTVLANEEVDEWVSKGYTVERRPMRQWMLRITAYAERLLDDLKDVDWPQGTLELQKNWIGRSQGASIAFQVAGHNENFHVFTTRPDTLFGATYMVLAPEHPLVDVITTAEQKQAVEDYRNAAARKSELDRQMDAEQKEKTGVFTGAYAVHPITQKNIPLWIADYVLMSYGTGAIMAVPAHDTRDHEFAKKFDLPIVEVIAATSSKEETQITDVQKEAYTGQGVAVNSEWLNGLEVDAAKEKMIGYLQEHGLGERQINYKLRDWLFSRQRYWGEPIPISFDDDGFTRYEEDASLPLKLPPSENFQPAESGESPLANLTDWVNYELEGKSWHRETNTMPQWAGSCWYYLRYIDPQNDKALVDQDKEKFWMKNSGVDLYVGGAEHAVLHLLYSRFWHKVLYDYNHVSSKEPFHKLVHQGLILGEDGVKMSKSRGNVINPDDVIKNYGADAFRLFEMFMGPLEQPAPWSTKGVEGVFRFLSRVWRKFVDDKGNIRHELLQEPPSQEKDEIEKWTHQLIKKISHDIETLGFNTAISALMIYINNIQSKKSIGKENAEKFILMLSPFAPHICEELWSLAGHTDSLLGETWPSYEEEKTKEAQQEMVFSVNGKVRGKAILPADIDETALKQAALEHENIQKFLDGKEPKKIIVVKNKMVNIVL